MCTDTNWRLVTLSASLTPVLLDLSSRGLSFTPATARGPPMLPSDMESVTESLSPPPLRTVTMCTDTNWPLVTLSASLTPVLLDLSSRGLSFTPATARGPPMLPSDMASDTESLSPPPLRTATTSTDTNWPLATPSASLTPVLPALSSRGLSSTPDTARGPLMPMLPTVPLPLLRTATTSTDTSLLPSTPSASPTPASVDLTSRSLVSTPASTMVATTARGPLSLSTEELLSTLDVLSLPLRGLLRVSALDTAMAMGS